MEDAWGPAELRGAVAFVHIPPYGFPFHLSSCGMNESDLELCRHAIQVLQSTLDPVKNPGLNGASVAPSHRT